MDEPKHPCEGMSHFCRNIFNGLAAGIEVETNRAVLRELAEAQLIEVREGAPERKKGPMAPDYRPTPHAYEQWQQWERWRTKQLADYKALVAPGPRLPPSIALVVFGVIFCAVVGLTVSLIYTLQYGQSSEVVLILLFAVAMGAPIVAITGLGGGSGFK